jgi:hypothetical protein
MREVIGSEWAQSARRLCAWLLPLVAVRCAATTPRPTPPQFLGVETDFWLVQESEPTGRDDLLPAFEASARGYGCSTEKIGSQTSFDIEGERRSYFGVMASCDDGMIALITLEGGRVSIGCAKPTTLGACNALLRDISAGR